MIQNINIIGILVVLNWTFISFSQEVRYSVWDEDSHSTLENQIVDHQIVFEKDFNDSIVCVVDSDTVYNNLSITNSNLGRVIESIKISSISSGSSVKIFIRDFDVTLDKLYKFKFVYLAMRNDVLFVEYSNRKREYY